MRVRSAMVVCLWILLLGELFGQEQTAGIYGTVRDSDGRVLPGATVELTGTAFPGSAAVQTDSLGTYRFPSLSPGTYRLSAALEGMTSSATPEVELRLGQSLRIDHSLRVAALAQEIVVSAEAPLIDIRGSATASSFRSDEIDRLPKGRDFTSLASKAAGTANERFAGGLSIDGASGSDNRFIIDGADTTDPLVGTSFFSLITDFVAELQVKSAGYQAEFGGSTGGVINVITRSGGNEFQGDLRTEYLESELNGDERPTLQKDPATGLTAIYKTHRKDNVEQFAPGFSISGPIVRDRLWFFAGYQPQITATARDVDFVDAGGNVYEVRRFEMDEQTDNFTANVTGNLGPRLIFRIAANGSPYEQDRVLPEKTGRQNPAADYSRGFRIDQSVLSGYVDLVSSDRLWLSFRPSYYRTNWRDVGGVRDINHRFRGESPGNAFPEMPSELQRPVGFNSVGIANNFISQTGLNERVRLAGELAYLLQAGGTHQFKIGAHHETMENVYHSGEANSRLTYFWNRSYTTTDGRRVRGQYGYFDLFQPLDLGDGQSSNNALFVQDSWTLLDRLTLNLGLRVENEKLGAYGDYARNVSENSIEFDFGDKIAPRLGFAYDLSGDGKTKLYGSWGKYFDVMKDAVNLAFFGAARAVQYFYTLDSFDWPANECYIGSGTVQERPDCPAGTFIEAVDRVSFGALEPDLKPMESVEYQFGAQRQISANSTLEIRYVHKELERTIEDTGVLVSGIGEVYYIANPGEGITREINDPRFPPIPRPVRDYDALELTFKRRLSNHVSLGASYVYSRLWGNYSGLASSDENGRTSPNVNRFFDALANSFDASGSRRPVLGRLATDRPHQFEMHGSYEMRTGTSIGGSFYLASGTPISKVATVPPGLSFMPEGRGSMGRTPTISQSDLLIQHRFRFTDRLDFQLSLNILNLFDQDTTILVYNRPFEGDLPLTLDEFFAGFDPYSYGLPPDPQFGKPQHFQAPREVRLGTKLTF